MDYTYSSEGAAATGLFVGVLGVFLLTVLVTLAIHVVICLLLYKCFDRIPQEHRRLNPALVWLLMIPCFSLIWNFFVYPNLAKSFGAYFEAKGGGNVGDCGLGIAWAYAICFVLTLVPGIGWIASLAALVLLIIFLIKACDLKNRIAPE
jgi:hypothetical protein